MRKEIKIIVGIDKNGHIGDGGKLPWKHKKDMSKFVQKVRLKPILMGRLTYEELSKPLGIRNFVLTSKEVEKEGFEKIDSIQGFLNWYDSSEYTQAIIGGGSKVYSDVLSMGLDKEYELTVDLHMMDIDGVGDRYFPLNQLYNNFILSYIEFVDVVDEPSLTILHLKHK